MGCSSSQANDGRIPAPLERDRSFGATEISRLSERKMSNRSIRGVETNDDKYIAFILKTCYVIRKTGKKDEESTEMLMPLYVNVFASPRLRGNEMATEKYTTWDTKLPGTLVHSVMISQELDHRAEFDQDFKLSLIEVITHYLVALYPEVEISFEHISVIKIVKGFAGEDKANAVWFEKKVLNPIDLTNFM